MRPAAHEIRVARAVRRALSIAIVLALALAAPAAAKTWSGQSLPPGLGVLGGISCAKHKKVQHCVATGQDTSHKLGAVVTSDNGGKQWASQAVPAGIGGLFDVSCTSASHCVAAGADAAAGYHAAALTSSDGGKQWQVAQVPGGLPSLGWIACRSKRCTAGAAAMGNRLLLSSDSGATWTLKTLPLHNNCTGFCPGLIVDNGTFGSGSVAYAVGGAQCGGAGVTQCPAAIWKSTDGGDSWKLAFEGNPFVDTITCVDSKHCWAGAANFQTGVILKTTNGGKSWHPQKLPQFSGFFNSIACVKSKKHVRCFAVGQDPGRSAPVIAATSDGGKHWKLDGAPAGTGALFGVDMVGRGGRAVGQDPSGSSARAISR